MDTQETHTLFGEADNATKVITAFVLSLTLIAFFGAQVKAQANNGNINAPAEASTQQTEAAQQNIDRQTEKPFDLFRALNLSTAQQMQIKAIRRQNREARLAAIERLQRAQRELDEAIYANDVNETVIGERERELAAAQAEAVRVETQGQLNIRRVLTPEQLATLRGLRQQAREAREARRDSLRQSQSQQAVNANNPFPRAPDRFQNRRRNTPVNVPAGNNLPQLQPVTRERPAGTQRRNSHP